MYKVLVVFLCTCFIAVSAQELNCEIKVNSDRVTSANQQIFKTLETSLNEFVNKTKWTNLTLKQNERVECSMFINVSEFNANSFTATIQVQASRPVYNSLYSTPTFNFNDKDFSFRYVEFENLFFNPNSFDSNLVSVLAYYVYVILGIDADTYSSKGGTNYFEQAEAIVTVAQTGGYKGWSQSDGFQNRYFLVNDLLSNTFDPIRESMFQYHVNGLDIMADNLKSGKDAIKESLMNLNEIHNVRPNAFLTRVFFDTKSDEIVSVFSGGPNVTIADLVDNLNRISPLNSSKWTNIKF
ncbi:type IX secretion system protein PorD [Flavobacterium orientale]|uniref:DUF4835 domain-containing protein n=1 Tax=Flavobacterium orientale TaxID=1756020 RepID=A0A916XWB8_9FLAO|nr:DUF4835 family protein [Flavobacterium orientale]GGD16651.1 DUF4835 domain-containing protein [Flavobacterium orientale]